jgi:hypothetical protein
MNNAIKNLPTSEILGIRHGQVDMGELCHFPITPSPQDSKHPVVTATL